MKDQELFTNERLFCPGPTPVPQSAILAGMEANVYHRSETFSKAFLETLQLLQPVLGSKYLPVILASSGTGGLEAALTNLTEPGDEVAVINAGKFGERWEKLANTYQCQVKALKIAWGQAPTPDEVVNLVKSCKKPKALFFQANETSTGVRLPVADIAGAVRRIAPDILIVVDAISSLCAHSMQMHQWDIDCVIGGSQKGFGVPPGLAFISMSDRALDQLSQRPRFYFDFKREFEQQQTGVTAWTPATTLIFSLRSALLQIQHTGIAELVAHHQRLAKATRAAAQALGLQLFVKDSAASSSDALTAMMVPAGIDGSKIIKRLRSRFNAYFAGGQDQLKGKIIRFSHLGFMNIFDVLSGLAMLEFALMEEGYQFQLGAGVQAAMQTFKAPV